MKRKLLWKKEGALVSVLAVCVLLAACGEEETGTDAGEGSSVSGSVSEEISDADDASGGEGTNIPSGEESAEDFGGDEGADELTVECKDGVFCSCRQSRRIGVVAGNP